MFAYSTPDFACMSYLSHLPGGTDKTHVGQETSRVTVVILQYLQVSLFFMLLSSLWRPLVSMIWVLFFIFGDGGGGGGGLLQESTKCPFPHTD